MTGTTIAILIAFGAYLLLMVGIGVWSMKRTTGADDYFLGGRGLSGPVAAMSAQASDMSGWLLMGLPGSVYALGTGQAWIAIGLGLGTIINWLVIAKPLRSYTIVANNSMTSVVPSSSLSLPFCPARMTRRKSCFPFRPRSSMEI